MNAPRKPFQRKDIPWRERAVSFGLLLCLIAIGVAIAIKGRRYDPNRFALDPATLAATRAAVPTPIPANPPAAPSSQTPSSPAEASASSEAGYPSSAEVSAPVPSVSASTASSSSELDPPAAGLAAQGPTEHYDPDSLYKKIDGQAEGYLSFKFQHLRMRSFTLPGGYLDLYEYDMGEPINAYGIYALERDASAPTIDFAADGYRSELGYFLRQGRYYVQVLASDKKPELIAAAEQAARGMAQRLPADDAGLEGRKLLPTAGLNAKSLTFILSDGFGIAGLNHVFKAEYAYEGKTLTFFAARQADAAGAEKAFATARKMAEQFGKLSEEPAVGAAQVFSSESFGQLQVLYLRGDEIGGVVETDQPALARKFITAHLTATNPS